MSLWHFMLATAIGMLPGTLMATVFGHQLEAALRDPRNLNLWLIAAVIIGFGAATLWVRRWLATAADSDEQVTARR